MKKGTFVSANKIIRILMKQKAVSAILLMLLTMLFFETRFYTAYNFIDMLRSTSVLVIIGFGVTMTIVCGACDLSVGGVLSFSGIAAILLMNVLPMWIAILLALLLGALIGFINGFLVVQQKTEPFIITLGMGILLKGIAQQLTDANPVTSSNPNFMFLANGKVISNVPNLVIVMLVVMAVYHYLLRYTQFGRNCYAIGGDYEVAKNSGISVEKTKWITFIISGFTAALAGIMLASKMNTGSSNFGDTTALIVNCGVVIGGNSFAGGVGGIPQAFVGLFVLALLENCMNMLGINSYIQQAFQGVVIVSIIAMDCYGRKRKREAV